MDTSAAFSRHHAPGTRRRAPRPGVGRPECSQRRTTRRARSEACGRVCRICSCLRTTRRSLPAHMLRFNLANGKSFLKTSDACNNPESQSLGDRQQSVYDRYPIHSKSLDSEDPLVKKTSGPHRLSRHGPCLCGRVYLRPCRTNWRANQFAPMAARNSAPQTSKTATIRPAGRTYWCQLAKSLLRRSQRRRQKRPPQTIVTDHSTQQAYQPRPQPRSARPPDR